jgi:hypothetical protein
MSLFHSITSLSSLCIILLLQLIVQRNNAFQLSTTSTIKGVSSKELHDFLATPTNWPRIVASSNSVTQSKSKPNRVDLPLTVGDEVEEVFGLPPLLPLSVVWQCVTSSSPKKLEFYSSAGVPYLARDCWMRFSIEDDANDNSCMVKLEMEFDPVSPLLLIGATPLLKLDNDFALKVLLPNAIKK